MPTVTVPGGTDTLSAGTGITTPSPNGPGGTDTLSSGAGITITQQISNALVAALKETTPGSASVSYDPAAATIPEHCPAGGLSDTILGAAPVPTTITGSGAHPDNSIVANIISTRPMIRLFVGPESGAFTATGAINHSGGSDTICAAGVNTTINGGADTKHYILTGFGHAFEAGGTDTIFSHRSEHLIVGTASTAGSPMFNENGRNDTIIGGDRPTTVTASPAMQRCTESGTLTFMGGAGTSSTFGGAAAATLNPGPGTSQMADDNAFAYFAHPAHGAKDLITDFNSADAFFTKVHGTVGSNLNQRSLRA